MDLDAILDDALKAFEHQEVVLHKTSHTENGIVGKPTVASSNIEEVSLATEKLANDIDMVDSQPKDAGLSDDDLDSQLFDQLTQHLVDGLKDDSIGATETSPDQGPDIDEKQYDELMETVLQQLLNKDMMYEPTKHICDKFPDWLEKNKSKLTKEELEKYSRMFACFREILGEYEKETANFPRLMDLMSEVQQYGQPPPDIIEGVASGIFSASNSMPFFSQPSEASSIPSELRQSTAEDAFARNLRGFGNKKAGEPIANPFTIIPNDANEKAGLNDEVDDNEDNDIIDEEILQKINDLTQRLQSEGDCSQM